MGKKEMKGKNILYGLNVKIKDKLLFCILNFIENFIYMLSQFCVVNLWWEPRGLVPMQYKYCEEGVKFIISH